MYTLAYNINLTSFTFSGSVAIDIDVHDEIDTIVMHQGLGMNVKEVVIDGEHRAVRVLGGYWCMCDESKLVPSM